MHRIPTTEQHQRSRDDVEGFDGSSAVKNVGDTVEIQLAGIGVAGFVDDTENARFNAPSDVAEFVRPSERLQS